MIHVECITRIVKLKLELQILKSSLCDYSDAYILVIGTITVVGAGSDDAVRATARNNKQATFKNYTPFIDYIREIKTR